MLELGKEKLCGVLGGIFFGAALSCCPIIGFDDGFHKERGSVFGAFHPKEAVLWGGELLVCSPFLELIFIEGEFGRVEFCEAFGEESVANAQGFGESAIHVDGSKQRFNGVGEDRFAQCAAAPLFTASKAEKSA